MSWLAVVDLCVACLVVLDVGYHVGLCVGHGRGFHEAMKLASDYQNDE